jgi:hypothetical protein
LRDSQSHSKAGRANTRILRAPFLLNH